MKLTREEKALLDSVEKGEWKRISNFRREEERYRDSARAALRKDKYINGRLVEKSLGGHVSPKPEA